MTPLMEGFSDELEKLALVGSAAKAVGKAGKWIAKSPWRRGLLPFLVGSAGYQGAKAGLSSGSKRVIAAKGGRPSKAWYINYHKAIGIPGKMTKLQRERLSRNFARYRERK